MKKVLKIILLAACAFLFIGTFVFLWQKARPSYFTYELVSMQDRTLSSSVIASGNVNPENEVQIKPQISGIISEIRCEPGDDLKQGDIVAVIKVVPEMGSLNSAEGRLTTAKINYDKILKDHKRNEELFKKEIASLEEYEASLSALETAEEEVKNAEDALKIITDGVSEKYAYMSNTQVRSTINGKVLDVPVEVGNSVIQANTFNDGTTIALVADMRNMIFKGEVDEIEVGKLEEGMDASISIGAIPGKKFDGILTYISPKSVSDESSNIVKFEIEAVMPDLDDSVFIRAGYSANAEIIIEKKENVPSIPEGCLQYDEEGIPYVEVYKGMDGKKQVFERRDVDAGFSDGVYIEILGGLSSEDRIKGNIAIK